MSKFNSKNVYDLTQENMTAMLLEIEKQQEELDATLMEFHMIKKEHDEGLDLLARLVIENDRLLEALHVIASKGPASPGDKKHEIAMEALRLIEKE